MRRKGTSAGHTESKTATESFFQFSEYKNLTEKIQRKNQDERQEACEYFQKPVSAAELGFQT